MSTERDHWVALLAEANDALGAARDEFAAARSVRAWRDAAEDIEFWSNRKAFVEAALRSEDEPVCQTSPTAGEPAQVAHNRIPHTLSGYADERCSDDTGGLLDHSGCASRFEDWTERVHVGTQERGGPWICGPNCPHRDHHPEDEV